MDGLDVISKGGARCGDMDPLFTLQVQLGDHDLRIAWHLSCQSMLNRASTTAGRITLRMS